ncbi:MAG: HD domain-containing protein [Acidobacteriota bacterium]
MKSPYINELQPNHNIEAVFLVAHKEIRQKKTGEPYLSLTFVDRSGDLEAKMWDNAAEAIPTFEQNDFVRVKGATQVFQNKLQFTVHKLRPVPESEVDLGDFLRASKRDRPEMLRELLAYVSGMTNPHLKGLVEGLFANPAVAQAYRDAPAAKSVHHAWIGGLIEHVLSLCALAKMTASHYANIDPDLLLTGVILHDIGKIHELEFARAIRYGDQGQLLGHIQIGMQMVAEQARQMPDFPPRLLDLVLHMVLSHHGQLEYGSPKLPVFPEALLLHLLDNMDSKMETMRAMIDNDRLIEGTWTLYNSALERTVLKKDAYLNPADKPAEAAPANPHEAPKPKPEAASLFADKLRGALGSSVPK